MTVASLQCLYLECALSVPLAKSSCSTKKKNVTTLVDHGIKSEWIGDSNLYTVRDWPPGLKAFVNQLEDSKTLHLPRETSHTIGMKMILRLETQYVGAGVATTRRV